MPNSNLRIETSLSLNHIGNSRLILSNDCGMSDRFRLLVLDKDQWAKYDQKGDVGCIANLGKIIKAVEDSQLEGSSNAIHEAIIRRVNEASQKHNSRFSNVQWLKFLFIPWLLAKILHWTVFETYGSISEKKETRNKAENEVKIEVEQLGKEIDKINTNKVENKFDVQVEHIEEKLDKEDSNIAENEVKIEDEKLNAKIDNEPIDEKLNELTEVEIEERLQAYFDSLDKTITFDKEGLKHLKDFISQLHDEGYNGYSDGKPGPYYSGRRLFAAYEISAIDQEHWQIKLNLNCSCAKSGFDGDKGGVALQIIKNYLQIFFENKMDSIKIEELKKEEQDQGFANGQISIHWKKWNPKSPETITYIFKKPLSYIFNC